MEVVKIVCLTLVRQWLFESALYNYDALVERFEKLLVLVHLSFLHFSFCWNSLGPFCRRMAVVYDDGSIYTRWNKCDRRLAWSRQ